MNNKEINQLISKYFAGETTREEERHLKTYFSRENLPEELQRHADIFQYYQQQSREDATHIDAFAKINFAEGKTESRSEAESSQSAKRQSVKSRVVFDPAGKSSVRWSLRIAAGIVLLLVGFAAGQLLNNGNYASNEQVAQLRAEVQQMKDVLMNGDTYQNVSAGERLAAVNSSTQIPVREGQSDKEITNILIYTMNNDKNVNVRMAAAEALFRFKGEPRVRQALIESLGRQDEPLMQITLIDILVDLKAKNAIQEMEKMLVDTETRDVVRNWLETGIAELET